MSPTISSTDLSLEAIRMKSWFHATSEVKAMMKTTTWTLGIQVRRRWRWVHHTIRHDSTKMNLLIPLTCLKFWSKKCKRASAEEFRTSYRAKSCEWVKSNKASKTKSMKSIRRKKRQRLKSRQRQGKKLKKSRKSRKKRRQNRHKIRQVKRKKERKKRRQMGKAGRSSKKTSRRRMTAGLIQILKKWIYSSNAIISSLALYQTQNGMTSMLYSSSH